MICFGGDTMKRVVSILILANLLGCAGLLLEPDDSGAMRAAKVTTRVVLALPTIFTVEMYLFRRKQAYYEADLAWRLGSAREAVQSATTRFELDQAIALHNATAREANSYWAQKAAQQAQTSANIQNMLAVQARKNEAQAQRTHDAQQRTLDRVMRPIELPKSTHCTSRIVGNMVYTDCY